MDVTNLNLAVKCKEALDSIQNTRRDIIEVLSSEESKTSNIILKESLAKMRVDITESESKIIQNINLKIKEL